MTESEWLAATDPHQLVAYLQQEAHDRKGRLLAVACCRRIDHLMSDTERAAVTAGEGFADGSVTSDELTVRRDEVEDPRQGVSYYTSEAARFATYGYPISPWHGMEHVIWAATFSAPQWQQDCHRLQITSALVALIRCIGGNPFRPVAFDDSWRSETAVALATGIYAERAFDRLPILADALEEAGCDHPDVLTHCREANGHHARGCWVVDGVLGKQ